MRRCFEHLKLQLIGRNFFDPGAKVIENELYQIIIDRNINENFFLFQISIPGYQLEILPGYISSIRQHDCGVLMSADISHKVMRTKTVYDLFSELYNKDPTTYQVCCFYFYETFYMKRSLFKTFFLGCRYKQIIRKHSYYPI